MENSPFLFLTINRYVVTTTTTTKYCISGSHLELSTTVESGEPSTVSVTGPVTSTGTPRIQYLGGNMSRGEIIKIWRKKGNGEVFRIVEQEYIYCVFYHPPPPLRSIFSPTNKFAAGGAKGTAEGGGRKTPLPRNFLSL